MSEATVEAWGPVLSADGPCATPFTLGTVVKAGAGTGKTTALTECFMSLLAGETPLRAIVAVTFTRRAAREMRNRIRRKVAERRDARDPYTPEWARWNTLYREMDAARIGTIHSLCREILRFNPVEAVVEPEFAVLEPGPAALAREEAVDAAMLWAAQETVAEPIFDYVSVADLRPLLRQALERRLDMEAALALGMDALSPALAALESEIRSWLTSDETQRDFGVLRSALALAESRPKARADALYPVLLSALELMDKATEAAGLGDWLEAGHHARALADLKTSRGVAALWADLDPKGCLTALHERLELIVPSGTDPRSDRLMARSLLALRAAFSCACSRYDELKAQQGALDHDDLEARALRLLESHPEVRRDWQSRVQALLVDEYQDTNRRQARVLNLLAPDPARRFIVGDAKQSIYAFRGADVSIFAGECANAAAGSLRTLRLSHRTHASLMQVFNRLFAGVMGKVSSTQHDAPFEAMAAARPAEDAMFAPFFEVLLVNGSKADGSLAFAAGRLVERLHELHAGGAEWHDMAILCRRAASLRPYENALDHAGVPYVTTTARGFLERPEVRDVLNALVAIADPSNNVALAGFLRSPPLGIDDADLVNLALGARRGRTLAPGALWQALQNSDTPKAQHATALLRALGAYAGRTPVAEVLTRFLDETGYIAALTLAGQPRASRNLGKLVDDAHAARGFGIPEYLASLARMRAANVSEGEANVDSKGAVHLMTVHGAKGLEFPIVVLGDIAGKANSQSPFVFDPAIGVSVKPLRAGVTPGVLHSRAAAGVAAMEDAEDDRVLYVAATRARDRLILSGSYRNAEGWLRKVADALGMADLKGARGEPGAPQVVDAGEGVKCLVFVDGPEPLKSPKLSAPETNPSLSSDPSFALLGPLSLFPAAVAVPEFTPQAGNDSAVGLRARVVGSVVHEAIAEWRLPTGDRRFGDWLERRIRALGVANGAENRRIASAATALLRRFERHPLYVEIDGCPERHTEVPFVLPGQDGGAFGVREGRIDLLYRTQAGAWRVVDFKCSRLPSVAAMNERVDRGDAAQLRAYGEAVTALLDEPPTLTLCYLDVAGQIVVHDIAAAR